MESYRELLAQRTALEAKIQEARARELPAVVEEVRSAVVEYKLTERDLWPKRKRRTASEMAAARAASTR
jgi:DNA-binding protein H-NS